MLTSKVSFSFLTRHVGIEPFNLLKNSYRAISEDGHFTDILSDKKIAALLFENTLEGSFFDSPENLRDFCYAFPEKTQDKIKANLEISDFDQIRWTEKIATYFIEELGLSEKFRETTQKVSEDRKGYYVHDKPPQIFKKLKRYQSKIFFDAFDYIRETNFARCIIQMPTGSGKTRTSMEIVCESMNQSGRSVLWLANTEELCDQALESFNEVWRFIGAREARAINHMRHRVSSTDDKDVSTFHVASLQSVAGNRALEKLESKGVLVADIELVIVDEAHIAVAPTYKVAIDAIATEGAKLIGLTATPGRQLRLGAGSDQNQDLSDFFFSKLFELDTGNIPPIEYLRREGILSNSRFHSIEGASVAQILTENELRNCRKNNTIPKKIETLLTNDSRRTAAIFDQLVQLLRSGKKILFFGTSVAHSEMISTLIEIQGFRSAHVDGSTGKNRQTIISDFKEGEIQILCNYGVLSTGFDDPKIDVVFMARPTNSIVLYSQIIGRGLRGPLLGGTDVCDIYTVVDNIVDLPDNNDIYSYFDEYFAQSE
ncbi:DEAD/DEAH box helicase [bacterium]|nr:DEAD/DEAH box helicase [bacterium]